MMKSLAVPVMVMSAVVVFVSSCLTEPVVSDEQRAFAGVRNVLETNCVHCHGDNRLSTMPPISDSRALAKLIGPGKWIVPGNAKLSRFYLVVFFPDSVPGVMPPTGHAINPQELAILRTWIEAGANIPSGATIKFKPRGEMPRSR